MPKLEKELMIKNEQGLHARPAAMFVQIVTKYNSNVTILKGEEKVNGASIMGILTLGAQKDSKLKVEVEGDDAQALLDELEVFLKREEI